MVSPLVGRRHCVDTAILFDPSSAPSSTKFGQIPLFTHQFVQQPKLHCLPHNLEKQFGHMLCCLLSGQSASYNLKQYIQVSVKTPKILMISDFM